MNLTSIILSLLTPSIVSRIAVALGLPPATVQAAINAIIPAILAVVAKSTANAGVDALTTTLGKQKPGTLSHLPTLIGGADQEQFVKAGREALQSVLGPEATDGVTKVVAKFAGLTADAGSGLLGMMAPVVLGTLAQQQKANTLDSARLSALLKAQTPLFTAAMPAGLFDLLAAGGLVANPEVGVKTSDQPATASAAPGSPDNITADMAAEALRSAATAAALSALRQATGSPQTPAPPPPAASPPAASPPAPAQPAPETARLVAEAARKVAATASPPADPKTGFPTAEKQPPVAISSNAGPRVPKPPARDPDHPSTVSANSDWYWFAPFIIVVLLVFFANIALR